MPGLSAPYEPPLLPEVVVDGERDDPAAAVRQIVVAPEKRGFLRRGTGEATKTGKVL
ncbi:MAG: hypothetical protein OHK0028_14020 [Deltaproteobacteria bacterium]